tara:strand:- start:135 stop:425 length:291 start_codon:yes stop_codon:yes gene_type:complete
MTNEYTYDQLSDVLDTDEIIKNAFIRIKEDIVDQIINNIDDSDLHIFDKVNDELVNDILNEFSVTRVRRQERTNMFVDVDVDDMLSFLSIRPSKEA